jgi:Cof subfamily protein (haloacid dehalogenase superfamily)
MKNYQNRSFDLIAIDCDGTLLNTDKTISDGAREAIDAVKAAGMEVALITGRNLGGVKFITKELDLDGLVVGCGGAFIYDLKTSLTLESHPLPKKETIKLIRLCRERDILLVLENMDYSEYEKFVEEKESRDRAAKFNNRKVDDLMKVLDEGPIKAVIVGEPDDVGAALEDIESRNLQFNIAMSGPTSADILAGGVNKGSGLRSLARIKNLPMERIAVIGDWLNDLDMFNVSHFSIAMGNAPDELKAQADLIAPTNDEGGVAWALQEIINL